MPARLLALIASITVLLGSVSLIYPFGRDQGNYATAGWVVLEGGAPYADVFVFKPPATVLVHTLALALFGVHTWSIRVLDLGWSAASAVALALVVHTLVGRRTEAVLAGVVWGALYYQVDYWNIAQTDGWMGLPCTLALLAALLASRTDDTRKSLALWGASGLALGVAFTFKYTAAAMALPLVAVGLRAVWQRGRGVWLALPMAAAGFTIPLALMTLWLVGVGGWQAFISTQAELIPGYLDQAHRPRVTRRGVLGAFTLRGSQVDVGPLLYGGAGGLALAVLTRARSLPWPVVLVALWWLSGLASLVAQGRFFDYHYLALLPPSAAALALVIGALTRALRAHLRTPAAHLLVALGLVLALAPSPLGSAVADLAGVLVGQRSLDSYYLQTKRYNYRDYEVPAIHEVSAYLQTTTSPEDRVFVWGFDPAIHIRAQRRGVSRFLYNYPFRVDWGNASYKAELMQALEHTPPAAIVIAARDSTYGVTGNRADSWSMFQDFDELLSFVERNYTLQERIQGARRGAPRYRVYRRK